MLDNRLVTINQDSRLTLGSGGSLYGLYFLVILPVHSEWHTNCKLGINLAGDTLDSDSTLKKKKKKT